jgi:hypothetical protein
MSDEYKNPASVASLPVLPNSGKVEQLRQDPPTTHSTPAPAEIPATAATDPLKSIEYKLLEGRIIEALRQVYDPEIPVSIYDLGLSTKSPSRMTNR